MMRDYINNVPASAKAYVVARRIDGDLWYWGSWDDRDTANEVALQVGGEVFTDE